MSDMPLLKDYTWPPFALPATRERTIMADLIVALCRHIRASIPELSYAEVLVGAYVGGMTHRKRAVSVSEVADLFMLDRRSARRYLHKLVDDGIIAALENERGWPVYVLRPDSQLQDRIPGLVVEVMRIIDKAASEYYANQPSGG
jgi:predicted DNA-binding transcriptional regulator